MFCLTNFCSSAKRNNSLNFHWNCKVAQKQTIVKQRIVYYQEIFEAAQSFLQFLNRFARPNLWNPEHSDPDVGIRNQLYESPLRSNQLLLIHVDTNQR